MSAVDQSAARAGARPRLGREAWVNAALLTLLLAAGLGAAAAGEIYLVTLAAKTAILALAGVGLNLALGYGGMISFGHAAFFGLGGYVTGVLASHAQNRDPILTAPILVEGTTEMLVIWPIAVCVGALAALVIGALSLRSSGVYFIMITLAFAQMLYYFAIAWPAYGGEDGLPFYVRNNFAGFDMTRPLPFFGVCFALLLFGLWLTARLTRSRFGVALACARQNPNRLASVGVAPDRVRLLAFVVSGAITALAGALFADLNRFVSPDMLSWHVSGEIMVLVILGGIGRLCGPVAGAGLFILLEHWLERLDEHLAGVTVFLEANAAAIAPTWRAVLEDVSAHWQALLGLLLLVVVLYARGGVMTTLAGPRRHD